MKKFKKTTMLTMLLASSILAACGTPQNTQPAEEQSASPQQEQDMVIQQNTKCDSNGRIRWPKVFD